VWVVELGRVPAAPVLADRIPSLAVPAREGGHHINSEKDPLPVGISFGLRAHAFDASSINTFEHLRPITLKGSLSIRTSLVSLENLCRLILALL
jgi:hypothetical protein